MLKKFFWMCSGADPDLLGRCPKSEQINHAGIGGTVFFTALMAFMAGSYALYTVFDRWWISIGIGLLWGLLIFNLDRFIVSTIGKSGNTWKQMVQASPRLVLAIIIAVVISKPMELRLFEKEIDRVLLEEKNMFTLKNKEQVALQFSPEISRLTDENQRLREAIETKEKEVNTLYGTYIAEAEGTSGTFKLGKGPVYREKREKHDTELQTLLRLREENQNLIIQNEARLAKLREQQTGEEAAAQPVIDRYDGLMARVSALGKLPWMPRFFIFLLFVAIETAPVAAKLLSPKGAYAMRFEDGVESLAAWMALKKQQRLEMSATENTLNEQVYRELSTEEELLHHKKQKARELLRWHSETFFEQQKNAI